MEICFRQGLIRAIAARYDKTTRNFLAPNPFGSGRHSSLIEDGPKNI
jgi:hypothetical protein